MREKKVALEMRVKFGRKRDKDGKSLALKERQIRGFFSRRAGEWLTG